MAMAAAKRRRLQELIGRHRWCIRFGIEPDLGEFAEESHRRGNQSASLQQGSIGFDFKVFAEAQLAFGKRRRVGLALSLATSGAAEIFSRKLIGGRGVQECFAQAAE